MCLLAASSLNDINTYLGFCSDLFSKGSAGLRNLSSAVRITRAVSSRRQRTVRGGAYSVLVLNFHVLARCFYGSTSESVPL